uniref:Uncharacterized protein n=1 Tax=Ditylenchus dipsaci TaxID=166011 RepID=A0A915CNG4_9BILA
MELYIFHPEEQQKLYGCINITIENVPFEKRQHFTEGLSPLRWLLSTISYSHLIWDGGFAVLVPMLYIIFSILFFAKSHKIQGSKEVAKQQKMMLLQVFIISMFNFCACSIYVYMMYFVTTEALMHFAQFCWFSTSDLLTLQFYHQKRC